MSWNNFLCCWVSCEDPSKTQCSQPDRGQNNKSFKTTVVNDVMHGTLDHQDELNVYIGQVEGYAFKTAADIIQSQQKLIGDLKRELERAGSTPSAPTLSTFQRSFDENRDFIATGNSLMTGRPPQLQRLTQISLSYS